MMEIQHKNCGTVLDNAVDVRCPMYYKDDYTFSTAQLSFTYTPLSPIINYTSFQQQNINVSKTKYYFNCQEAGLIIKFFGHIM